MKTHQFSFNKRTDRSQFLYDHYTPLFKESVLDVGCFEAPLRNILPAEVSYTGVDIVGDPDITINLEECDRLPFDDNSMHTVICIEVLEHLNKLHFIMDEIFRIAQKEVIISLPNCWASARTPITRGSGKIAHYGLPFEAPVDRHKWFINVSEICAFFENYAKQSDKVASLDLQGVEKPRPTIVRSLRKLRHKDERYLNRYVHTVFGHFKINS